MIVRVVPAGDVALLADGAEVSDRARSRGLLGWIRRHPLAAFYALTFLLSWGYWVPDALAGGHVSHTLDVPACDGRRFRQARDTR